MTILKSRPHCLRCNSSKVWRNGHSKGVQRYLCGSCGYEFTELQVKRHVLRKSVKGFHPVLDLPKLRKSLSIQNRTNNLSFPFSEDVSSQFPSNVSILGKPLSRLRSCSRHAQVGACEGRAKNLDSSKEIQKIVAKAEDATPAGIKGKIVEYSFWLLKQGYAKSTIKGRTKLLKRLTRLGANLYDHESVKEIIAKQEWSIGRKSNAVDAYTSFLQMHGIKWEPPIYKRIRKFPFIPTETEIDQLIAGCNRRMATFLQLLKETGMRCGEACKLKWTDINLVNNSVRVTPEKGSNARILKISNKLVEMFKELPKHSLRVFGANSDAMRKSFQLQRKRIAAKLRNPRLPQISFHTFRHWKATMEYHKTRDILHVMQILGHRNIQNTLIYTQLVDFKDDEYAARVASSEKEVCQLIEAGFEYVCDYDGNKVFRKRK
jgi:integrase/ribosomal protein S27AE